MNLYSGHKCTTDHVTHRGNVQCMLPHALVSGEGHFAVIAWCGPTTTVSLHSNLEPAEEAMAFINETGCGGQCERKHELVLIEIAAPAKTEVIR